MRLLSLLYLQKKTILYPQTPFHPQKLYFVSTNPISPSETLILYPQTLFPTQKLVILNKEVLFPPQKLVILNKEVLLSMRTNFDKPEQMKDLSRKLQQVDSVLSRMQIIGVILCFRQLTRLVIMNKRSEDFSKETHFLG